MVDRGGLENRWGCKPPGGSNPSPSATPAQRQSHVSCGAGRDCRFAGKAVVPNGCRSAVRNWIIARVTPLRRFVLSSMKLSVFPCPSNNSRAEFRSHRRLCCQWKLLADPTPHTPTRAEKNAATLSPFTVNQTKAIWGYTTNKLKSGISAPNQHSNITFGRDRGAWRINLSVCGLLTMLQMLRLATAFWNARSTRGLRFRQGAVLRP